MPRFTADALRAMCAATFEAVGFAPNDAGVIARLMVEANLVGHDSHGVRHIPVYVERVRNGLIVPDATLSVKQETAATAVLEGGNILGHVAATRGMEMAIKRRATATSPRSPCAIRSTSGELAPILSWRLKPVSSA